ncbi:hypothetical protein E3Q11_03161 [Wallemia mellicola]|uniref:C2H2-type domain-containing protein n=1 Tax=Wallemia mellicola TaxID=1708541 RepID=A0A4T0TET8_9BASI|nr:hypothetical protein E3Q11_03161 [Wallemia mellicola]TIC63696.1 hypothetical protein E3Q01_03217 [Wallemia mellicola]
MSISIPLETFFKFELLVSINVSQELDFELVPILTQNDTKNVNPSAVSGDCSTKNIELRSLDFPDRRVIKINLNDSLNGKKSSSTTSPLFEAKDTTMDFNVSTQPHQSMSTGDHSNNLAQNILNVNSTTANEAAGLDSSIDFSKILQDYLDGSGFKEQTTTELDTALNDFAGDQNVLTPPKSPEFPMIEAKGKGRPWTCPVSGCGRQMKKEYTFRLHMNSHNCKPTPSYPCSYNCGVNFSRTHDRLRHEVNRHGKKPDFICSKCSKVFLTERVLLKHSATC